MVPGVNESAVIRHGVLLGTTLFVLALLSLMGIAATSAQADPMGVTGFFGNPSSTGETTGGRFSTTPSGAAVNDTAVADATGADGNVYVVDRGNNRVERFDASGGFISAWGADVVISGGAGDTSEKQTLTIAGGATGGSFTLGFGATAPTTTGPIAFGANAAEVKSALEQLGDIGPGNIAVSGAPGGPYAIEFVASKASVNLATITANSAGLTPAGTATVATVQDGASHEICTNAAECKAGAATPTTGGTLSNPQGIAINQVTGHLYVSNATLRRIDEFTASGVFVKAWGSDVAISGSEQAEEEQTLAVNATAGQYKLNFGAGGAGVSQTADIDWNAAASTVQSALESITNIGPGNVTVSGGPGGEGGITPYLIAFTGNLANANQAAITTAAGSVPLSGGAATATILTRIEGGTGFEICAVLTNCKAGVAGSISFSTNMSYPAVVPAGAPGAGNVIVGDSGKRVSEFTSAGLFVRSWGWNVVSAGVDNTVGNQFELCRAAMVNVCKEGTNPATTGTGLGQFGGAATATPARIAVDGAGSIYVLESAAPNFRLQKFTPSGGTLVPTLYCPTIGGSETACGTAVGNTPTDVVTDSSTGHLFIVKAFEAGAGTPAAVAAERRILEFDAVGLVETHLVGSSVSSINGLAVPTGATSAYATTSTPKAGVFVLGPPVPPTVLIQPSTAITSDSAMLHGTVNPNGGGPIHTTYRFELSTDGGANWTRVTSPPDPEVPGGGNGEAAEPVNQLATGLEPNQDYKVRLVAVKAGSPTPSTGNAGDFMTDPGPPVVETFAAFWDAAAEELVLRGSVNPSNSVTTYYFEYGTSPCSANPCTSVPIGQDEVAGSGGAPIPQTQRVAGLTGNTTYYYRLVADNGVEVGPGVTEVEGVELTIKTPPISPCPNAQFREGTSGALPECRAYEWVSNGNGWGVGANTLSPLIADDGDRAQFIAQAFGQPNSVPGPNNPYTAVRGADGWSVRSVSPPPEFAFGTSSGLGSTTSSDLGTMLWAESTLGQRQRGEVKWGLIGLDGKSAPAAPLMTPVQHSGINEDRALNYVQIGVSSNLSTFAFIGQNEDANSGFKFLPDEPLLRGSRSNLYMVTGAGGSKPTLEIANRADGAAGAVIGGVCGAGLGSFVGNSSNIGSAKAANAISADGSVVYFTIRPGSPTEGVCGSASGESSLAGPKRLFKRENGETTIAVTTSQCSPACGGPEGDDEYRGASTDGSVTIFLSPRRLLNADTDNGSDLYVYDAEPPAGQPTLALASGGSGANAMEVFGSSADGSRVYFTAQGVLAGSNARGESPIQGAHNLYVYQRDDAHPTGRTAFVATLASGDYSAAPSYALPRSGAEQGSYLVFYSAAKLLDEDTDANRDVYRFDDLTGELLCFSCMGNGAFNLSPGALGFPRTEAGEGKSQPSSAQRVPQVSADGSAVVFVTEEKMLPDADVNSVADVYLWREGSLSLVSDPGGVSALGLTGISNASISADGKSIFFFTNSALVGGDSNNGPDLYTARIDGGFSEPTPPPHCTSNAECQSPEPTPLPPEGSGSNTNPSLGNVTPTPPPKPCKKGQVRKKGKCVKKPTHRGKRGKGAAKNRAGHNRGGNR
ncbi:MAG TPA: hypothetical protein VI039_06480 [Solirubrobacterales bacterium]